MQVTYVWRAMSNFIEDFIDIKNGTTHVVKDGIDFGTFTNIVFRNTDVPKRDYQGLVFQADYRLRPDWHVAGNYTLQLKNNGTFSGENANQPGISSNYGDYPVPGQPSILTRAFPDGRLYDYQQSKLRLWTIYMLNLNRMGNLSFSGLLRADSALTYSLQAASVPLSDIQTSLLEQAGYPDSPASQTVFFGDRGSQFFKGYALVDTSINYEIPVFKNLRPWLKFDVYNLLNNQKLIAWNTTVNPDWSGPVDSMGIPTQYRKGSRYGTATSANQYPLAYQGQNGGRTFRVSFGMRF
jgi:hypothetical protein